MIRLSLVKQIGSTYLVYFSFICTTKRVQENSIELKSGHQKGQNRQF